MTSLHQTILLTTGASGGHMFPALATADELKARGFHCVFVVGGAKFQEHVKAAGYAFHQLPASPFNVGNPLRKIKALLNLGRAVFRAVRVIQETHPAAVFGTGGYATVAMVFAAKITGVPVILHEQNMLPGRANKLLARFADHIALTFAATKPYFSQQALTVTGNPIRSSVLQALATPHKTDKNLHVLVTGGSQGARVLNEVVPEIVARLPQAVRKKLVVQHQARPEDVEDVTAAYHNAQVKASVTPFIENMGQALAEADFVLSRAGAGAVVEISTYGKPALYVPHPLADGHQTYNAQVPEKAGAALILQQDEFTPENVLPLVQNILENADKRADMGKRAAGLFPPHAAAKVADVIQTVAKADVMTGYEA